MISSAGYRIGPFEVESTLKEHPAVLESAAVGSPDLGRNEIVKAFIVLTKEYETKDPKRLVELALELQNFCKTNAAPYKYPREVSPSSLRSLSSILMDLVDPIHGAGGIVQVQDCVGKDSTRRAEEGGVREEEKCRFGAQVETLIIV